MNRAAKVAFVALATVIILTSLSAFLFFWSMGEVRGLAAVQSCIANLKELDGATAAWALEHGKTNRDDIPTDSDLFGMTLYLRDKPRCPHGGHYSLGSCSARPRCSIPSHSLEFGDVYVRDEHSNVVSEAAVRVKGGGRDYTMRTDARGFANIECRGIDRGLKPGTTVTVGKHGFLDSQLSTAKGWPLNVILRRARAPESPSAQH